jgi:hypothetical protein
MNYLWGGKTDEGKQKIPSSWDEKLPELTKVTLSYSAATPITPSLSLVHGV